MRAALAIAFCILGCATDSIGGDVEMRSLTNGSYAAAQPEQPQAIQIVAAGDYARIWDETIGSGERPQIDFATESVVILLAGSKPTGGYSVEPRSVRLDGRVLVVDAVVQSPPSGAIVTQAFTSPFAVIAVKTKALDSVRWNP
jgi:hypothetical protein